MATLKQIDSATQRRREALRVKMCEHDRIASHLRKKIKVIDAGFDVARRDAVIGKCFRYKDGHQYGRVDYFRKSDFQPMGTILTIFGKGAYKIANIEINHNVYWDYMEQGTSISNAVFNKRLRSILSMIKTKKPKQKNDNNKKVTRKH